MNLYKEEYSVFDYIQIFLENLPDAENVIPDPYKQKFGLNSFRTLQKDTFLFIGNP